MTPSHYPHLAKALPMPDTDPTALENEQPWNRLTKENDLWYSRFLLFRDLGPARKVHRVFVLEWEKKRPGENVPAINRNWYQSAEKYKWIERANAWDEYRRKEVYTQGYASELERIAKLDKLIARLEERIIKAFQSAKEPKGISYELLDLYLKAIEAIAKETGGRVQRKEVTGAGGAPLEVLLFLPEQEQDELTDVEEGDSQQWQ